MSRLLVALKMLCILVNSLLGTKVLSNVLLTALSGIIKIHFKISLPNFLLHNLFSGAGVAQWYSAGLQAG
jgi:hypothetical protein